MYFGFYCLNPVSALHRIIITKNLDFREKYMYKFFEKLLNKPRASLAVLGIVSLISITGIFLLEYDNSYETGMPKGDPDYILGEQTKKLFKDTETYLLLSIEPAAGKQLLTHETFVHINRIVDEINEYKVFNRQKEDLRLKNILQKAGITIIPPETKKDTGDVLKDNACNKKAGENYPEPVRKRNMYEYGNYMAVSLNELRSCLDPLACDTLDTILNALEIRIDDPGKKIELKDFKKILEAWEDIYLYKSLEIVEVFSNPVELSDINGANDTLRGINLIEKDENGKRILPSSDKDFDKYRKKLFGNPLFRYNYYSPGKDGEIRALAASMMLRRQQDYEQFMNYFWAMIRKYDHDPVHMYLQGGLVFDKFINDFNKRDLQKYIPLVLLVVILTFYFNFRTVRGVVLPTLTVIIATVITVGVMGFFGVKLTMVSTLLPPIIITTGSSYSIRIFNQHLLDLKDTHAYGKLAGLKQTLYKSFPTVFLAGLTTFIGFMTMVVNRIPALSDLGLFAALGTALSVVVSIILIICVLYLMELLPLQVDMDGNKKVKSNRIVSSTVDFCSRITLKYHTQIVIVALITIIASLVGISRITTETSATSFFKKDSYLRKSLSRTNELFRGTYIINVVFSPGENKSILDHDFLQYIEDVRQWLDQPGQDTGHRILYNSGFGDFVKRMNMAMNNEDPSFYSIPDTMTVLDYMELFSGDDDNNDGRPDMFETTISPGYDKTNLMVRIGTFGDEIMTTKKSQMTIEYIQKYLDGKPNPGGYTYLITGGPTNFNIVSKYIVQGQIEAIILSIIIIFILMFLLYRNLAAGIISMIPVSSTVIWIFGIMGFIGIPLGMAQSLIASIAIGIGVDDTIQFTIILRRNMRNGMDLRSAVRASHLEAGLAMIYTSLSLFWGFSIFVFSHFTPIQESGMLVSGVMLFATMANLILLPSLVLTFRLQIHRIINLKFFELFKIYYLLDEREER